jgi:hypothetical protein
MAITKLDEVKPRRRFSPADGLLPPWNPRRVLRVILIALFHTFIFFFSPNLRESLPLANRILGERPTQDNNLCSSFLK